jgi:hypothetical protein
MAQCVVRLGEFINKPCHSILTSINDQFSDPVKESDLEQATGIAAMETHFRAEIRPGTKVVDLSTLAWTLSSFTLSPLARRSRRVSPPVVLEGES